MTAILELPHGLHRDVSADVYHAPVLGMVSKSALDLVGRSPAHYRSALNSPASKKSPALAFGSALHCAILEPDRFGRSYVVAPSFGDLRNKENRYRRDVWEAEHASHTFLSADDMLAISGMRDSVMRHPYAGPMFEMAGDNELTLRWKDSATGLECRGRADRYLPSHGVVLDLKSTQDARGESFRRSVVLFSYHRQHAIYWDGFEACGVTLRHFLFLAVEKEPPYAAGLFKLDADAVNRGRASIRRDMETLARCLERDEWPAYVDEIQTLSLPPWADRDVAGVASYH